MQGGGGTSPQRKGVTIMKRSCLLTPVDLFQITPPSIPVVENLLRETQDLGRMGATSIKFWITSFHWLFFPFCCLAICFNLPLAISSLAFHSSCLQTAPSSFHSSHRLHLWFSFYFTFSDFTSLPPCHRIHFMHIITCTIYRNLPKMYIQKPKTTKFFKKMVALPCHLQTITLFTCSCYIPFPSPVSVMSSLTVRAFGQALFLVGTVHSTLGLWSQLRPLAVLVIQIINNYLFCCYVIVWLRSLMGCKASG